MFFRCRAFRGVTTAILMASLWAAGSGGNAVAADLQVSPISLEFSPREQARGIWLSNTGAKPLRAQVRVQQWTQTDNQDQLTPTRELSASPPAVDIPPGGKQLVRIIRQQPVAPAVEQSYRLIIDELQVDTVDGSPPPGLQFLLRYLVPVFVAVEPASPADPRQSDISALSASLQTASKPPQLVVKNTGRKHFKLAQLAYVDADGRRTVVAPGLLGYVLAGQQMQWPLKVAPAQGAYGAGAFKAKFNADLEEQTLPLVNTRP
jgi:fimbrial chaperone protein